MSVKAYSPITLYLGLKIQWKRSVQSRPILATIAQANSLLRQY